LKFYYCIPIVSISPDFSGQFRGYIIGVLPYRRRRLYKTHTCNLVQTLQKATATLPAPLLARYNPKQSPSPL